MKKIRYTYNEFRKIFSEKGTSYEILIFPDEIKDGKSGIEVLSFKFRSESLGSSNQLTLEKIKVEKKKLKIGS